MKRQKCTEKGWRQFFQRNGNQITQEQFVIFGKECKFAFIDPSVYVFVVLVPNVEDEIKLDF